MKSLAKFLSSAPSGAQAALAKHFGVNDSTVLRWKRGEIVPEPHVRHHIEMWIRVEKQVARMRNAKKSFSAARR